MMPQDTPNFQKVGVVVDMYQGIDLEAIEGMMTKLTRDMDTQTMVASDFTVTEARGNSRGSW